MFHSARAGRLWRVEVVGVGRGGREAREGVVEGGAGGCGLGSWSWTG